MALFVQIFMKVIIVGCWVCMKDEIGVLFNLFLLPAMITYENELYTQSFN